MQSDTARKSIASLPHPTQRPCIVDYEDLHQLEFGLHCSSACRPQAFSHRRVVLARSDVTLQRQPIGWQVNREWGRLFSQIKLSATMPSIVVH
jgi:hypothetical protein